GWRMHADPAGQDARTGWAVLDRSGGLALVAFRPETGRTHQIRVHATLMGRGASIVGDTVYGAPNPGGLMLHARALGFPAPPTSAPAYVVAPVPERFKTYSFDWKKLADA
ncbi:MAG: RNA pseudouridine synthase, partial [Sandaracinobacteroides sp.]